MEPIEATPDSGVTHPTAKRSRIKAALAAIVVAGALSTLGVVSVFAASPSPAASSGATASDDGSGSSTDTTGHSCPAHDAAATDSSSSSSS